MAPYRGDFREKPRVFTADDDNMWSSLRTTGQSLRSFAKLSTKITSFAEHCSSAKEVDRGKHQNTGNQQRLPSYTIPCGLSTAQVFILTAQLIVLTFLFLQLIVVVKSLVSHII